jgi:hypothetical protein
MKKPTCEELLEIEDTVCRATDDSWRHGCRVSEVYHRASDGTYWEANYNLSTDGETHGLADGDAEITEVEPVQETVTSYVAVEVDNE